MVPFWIIPSNLFPLLCLQPLVSCLSSSDRADVVSPEPPLHSLGRPWHLPDALAVSPSCASNPKWKRRRLPVRVSVQPVEQLVTSLRKLTRKQESVDVHQFASVDWR